MTLLQFSCRPELSVPIDRQDEAYGPVGVVGECSEYDVHVATHHGRSGGLITGGFDHRQIRIHCKLVCGERSPDCVD